jgi:LmbE family N-acetylglucosaminyl deacetylase
VPFTLVSFHAHPDDEVLFTGGTIARAAAEGHRVILVLATAGEAGLAHDEEIEGPDRAEEELSRRRLEETERSAAALGCADVVCLGFADSGWRTEAPSAAFSRMPVAEAAAPLINLLRRERADALTIYDRAGGYGHPDHRQVHLVGLHAAQEAGTPVVLEATIDRDLIRPLVRLACRVPGLLPGVRAADYRAAYTPRRELTHRVNVRGYAGVKREALRAHASQASGEDGLRTVALLLKLPFWLFRWLLGTEWYVEHGRSPGQVLDDVFASLRG